MSILYKHGAPVLCDQAQSCSFEWRWDRPSGCHAPLVDCVANTETGEVTSAYLDNRVAGCIKRQETGSAFFLRNFDRFGDITGLQVPQLDRRVFGRSGEDGSGTIKSNRGVGIVERLLLFTPGHVPERYMVGREGYSCRQRNLKGRRVLSSSQKFSIRTEGERRDRIARIKGCCPNSF